MGKYPYEPINLKSLLYFGDSSDCNICCKAHTAVNPKIDDSSIHQCPLWCHQNLAIHYDANGSYGPKADMVTKGGKRTFAVCAPTTVSWQKADLPKKYKFAN
jgi:hypothetical protein